MALRHDNAKKNLFLFDEKGLKNKKEITDPFVLHQTSMLIDGYYSHLNLIDTSKWTKSHYRVAVGRSKDVAGPYLDKAGKDMLNGGGTVVMEGDKKNWEAAVYINFIKQPERITAFLGAKDVKTILLNLSAQISDRSGDGSLICCCSLDHGTVL